MITNKALFILLFSIGSLRPAAVTYDSNSSSLSDNLLSYCHARWISYKYDIPLLYKPFPHSDKFSLHFKYSDLDKRKDRNFDKIVNLSDFTGKHNILEINKSSNILYVVPCFSEEEAYIEQFNFDVNWKEPGFQKILREEFLPVKPVEKADLPKDQHLVALHVNPENKVNKEQARIHQLEFSNYHYYTEQLLKLSEMLHNEPMYVKVFGSDPEIAAITEYIKKKVAKPHIEFHYHQMGCEGDSTLVDDLFALLNFEYLIGSNSNFSLIAEKLKTFVITIRPNKFSFNLDQSSGEAITLYSENSPLYYGTYSNNYVLRWCFQSICHHAYDFRNRKVTKKGGISFKPEDVKPGDLVFVRDIEAFMNDLHPRIKHPYIILTAGECLETVLPEFLVYLDSEKILAWFSIHPCSEAHPKFHPIPLGIMQDIRNYRNRKDISKFFAELRQKPKSDLVYANFNISTNKDKRKIVHELFKGKDFCYEGSRKPFCEYIDDMAQHKFTLSPTGTGPDTYRTWEALLIGTIPIVLSSHMDSLYADLPVLIVKSWDEVTPAFLKHKYQEMTEKKYNIEKLFMEHWWKQIDAVRDSFFKSINNQATNQS